MNVCVRFDEILSMALQVMWKILFMHIHNPLRITKGNNSHRNGPSSLLFIIIICHVDINVYARFDEILSITLKDIKKTKRYGRTEGRMDGQRENSIPAHKHSLRGV